jgi:transcriptional regulator with XRE-family HTH domain
MTHSDDVRKFLASRRARITPEEAGLPAYGGNRRVTGLRREEVAMLAGMSIDYYIRLERGNLSGASDSVLEALCRALKLDDAETAQLKKEIPARFGDDLTLEFRTNPSLLGGARITVGNDVWDGSVKARLTAFSQQL